MQRLTGFNEPARAVLRPRFPALVLAAGSLATAGLGITAFVGRANDRPEFEFSTSCAVFVLACSLVQLRVACRAAFGSAEPAARPWHRRPVFLRWLFLGMAVSYGLGLAIGPRPGVEQVFQASLVGWYTLAVVVRSLERRQLEWLRAVFRWQLVDRMGMGLAVAAMVLLAGESAARMGRLLGFSPPNLGRVWLDAAAGETAPAAPLAVSRRLALVGDEALLAADAPSLPERLAVVLPDWECVDLIRPASGPREYGVLVAEGLNRYRPELIVLFISLADDLGPSAAANGPFDLRSLALYDIARGGLGSKPAPEETTVRAGRRTAAERLAVCRTPLDAAQHEQWQQALGRLADLSERVARGGAELVLVLVPAEFQVRPALCARLRHRAGIREDQLDLDLPQRRLDTFAASRRLAVIDLTPHLRACGARAYVEDQGRLSPEGQAEAALVVQHWLDRAGQRRLAAGSL